MPTAEAIAAYGTALTLAFVDVVGNSVTGGDGGNGFSPVSGAGGAGGAGGSAHESGIDTLGHVTLDRVTVAGNVAHGGAGGKGGTGSGSNAGGAGGDGGSGNGAIGTGSGFLVIRDSTISGNRGFSRAAGDGGSAGPSGGGHGGHGGASKLASGGGIFSNNDVVIVNSTITGNELHGAAAGNGGAGPFGTGGDGGYAEGADGGGIALFNGATGHVASSTIAGNAVFAGVSGAGGAGIVAGSPGPASSAYGGNLEVASATLEIRDSVIAGGIASPSFSNCDVDAMKVTSHGYNVEDKNQCLDAPATGDRHDLDPKLGPLQDNGGPTKTMAPLSGSPLVDGGPPICQGIGTPLTADQRGMPRGAVCDNGAYEAIPPAVTAPPTIAGSPVTGQTLTCQARDVQRRQPLVDRHHLAARRPADGGRGAVPDPRRGRRPSIACRQTATNPYGSASAR